ncbi:DNA gyrase subunit A [Candidatus Woesearchaeota archaeon]|nr:DNA gyrase subunit A [Candidatus Woesearchaeota archaeon]
MDSTGRIISREIDEEMKTSYLDYAMSVLVARALPDARDGLKPVHRRVLYAMYHDLGLLHNKPYRKSARIVGECFVKDTLVLTERGILPIQDVKRSDNVYTQNGLKSVSELYIMPEKQLLSVKLMNGLQNTVTLSQKFKVLGKNLEFEWKEAKDLIKGDYLVLKAEYPDIKENIELGTFAGRKIFLGASIAYILGLLISDGWLELAKNRLFFFSTSKESIDRVKRVLADEFGYAAVVENKDYDFEQYGIVVLRKAYQIRINSSKLNSFLVESLKLHNISAYSKRIPAQILRSPKKVIFSFVSGLVDGDGSVHKSRSVIHYGSVSEKLIDQLQVMMLHLGILGMKYRDDNLRPSFSNSKEIMGKMPFFSLEFSSHNCLALAKNLELLVESKAARAEKIGQIHLKQTEFDAVPYSGRLIFEELSAAHLGGGWYSDASGGKFRLGIKYSGGSKIRYSKNLKEKVLGRRQMLDWGIKDKLSKLGSKKANFIESVIRDNLFFVAVDKIEPAKAQETYDVQVENDHEFVANGVISHNCLGKYHPHSDIAVYDTMVRMAQDFSLRYPLIDGQGNWGSVDGDSAAAIRYTEARLSSIAEDLLADIDRETAEFVPNVDACLMEPVILPTKIPNLLINGSSGIAVGTTNIPPHNFGEVADAVTAYIESHVADREMDVDALMLHIKAPDFPTGGIICGLQGVKQAYRTGRGLVTVRARTEVEAHKDRQRIIVTELPFQINKAQLIEEMADMVHEKKISGISDLRDESDKEGMRIVIELKKDSNPEIVLNQLFTHTKLEATFGIIMIALVNGEPKTLALNELIQSFVSHRKEVVTRRTQFDLSRAEEKAHILEGIIIALNSIDAVIKAIRDSMDAAAAKQALLKGFRVTEKQALAILDMRLQRLASLEQEKVRSEHKGLLAMIVELKGILASEAKIFGIIKSELAELRQKYADRRRTAIEAEAEEMDTEDLITPQDVAVTITRSGYIKRMSIDAYRQQKRGGKGVIATETREQDFVESIFIANTHSYILFFTDKGTVHWLKVHQIPEAARQAMGKAIVNMLEIGEEKVTAFVPVKRFDSSHYLIMSTIKGTIKKTSLAAYSKPRRGGIIAITLEEGDNLIGVEMTNGSDDIILATKNGLAARFSEQDVRASGRSAQGVRGIRLKYGDEVIGMVVADEKKSLITLTENGYGKRTPISEYRHISRGGKGVISIQATDRNGKAVVIKPVSDSDELMLVSKNGIAIRVAVTGVSVIGRNTQGVRIMKLEESDKLVAAAVITRENSSNGNNGNSSNGSSTSKAVNAPQQAAPAQKEKT